MDIEIEEGKFSKIINALKPDKSQGPDRIHPRILKETNQFVKLLLEKKYLGNHKMKVFCQKTGKQQMSLLFTKAETGKNLKIIGR